MVQDGLPIYVEEVAKYEIKNGHIHIVYRRLGLELVVPLDIAMASRAAVGQALEEWQRRGSAEIIPVEFDSKFERVFGKDKTADH